ncbi:MAG: hypothetical protein ACYTJ0_09670, partial [Planctomycetota bacterium]
MSTSATTSEHEPAAGDPDNTTIAAALEEVADLLEAQGANPFRVRAYRQAAVTVRRLDEPVHAIVRREGADALQRLPGIGSSLARA